MNPESYELVIGRFLAFLEGDWTPACALASIVEGVGVDDATGNRQMCLAVIRQCLAERLLRIGYVVRTAGFVPWTGSDSDLVERLAQAWPSDRVPTLGEDPCWFEASDALHGRLRTLRSTLGAALDDHSCYGYFRIQSSGIKTKDD